MSKSKILIVDDLEIVRFQLHMMLDKDYVILDTGTQKGCLALLAEQDIRLVILDLIMPDVKEFELLEAIKVYYPHIHVVMFTTHDKVKAAVQAIKMGADDYILKDDLIEDPELLRRTIKTILQNADTQAVKLAFQSECGEQIRDILIPPIRRYQELYERTLMAARGGLSIMICGETGTGKDVLTRYLHQKLMPNHPLITINCGAICNTLSESELFGHERGSFTGAEVDRVGKFEMANNGMLFLDELGNMPIEIQKKVLCIIEDKKVTRVGSTREVVVNFLLVAATNSNLEKAIQENTFRNDLYYRIKQFSVELPALREQRELIPPLARHFAAFFNQKYQSDFIFTDTVLQDLQLREWPGNIRELKNEIQLMVLLHSQGNRFVMLNKIRPADDNMEDNLSGRLGHLEKNSVIEALIKNNHSISAAARHLGIPRSTLQGKMKKYGIGE